MEELTCTNCDEPKTAEDLLVVFFGGNVQIVCDPCSREPEKQTGEKREWLQ